MTRSNEPPPAEKNAWIRKRLVPALALLLALGVTAGLFFFAQQNPDKIKQFASYGYLGVSVISLISNATVILPVPGILFAFPLVDTLNPILLGVAGSVGGIIGEITGYMAGYGGRAILPSGKRVYGQVEGWMKRWGPWTIFVFSAAPFLPLDVAGMVAGALRFPLWKFMLFGFVGKTIKYVLIMLGVAWGWKIILPYFRVLG